MLATASTAQAVRDPDDLTERTVETSGTPVRQLDHTSWYVPDAAARPWVASRFSGPGWTALWDADTAVPQRIYGEGIAIPGSMADAAIAERGARALLEAELAVLAPGAKPGDFEVSINQLHMDGKRRTVAFAQRAGGLRVEGARVGFLFANDRIFVIASTAAPDLAITAPGRTIDADAARTAARGWIVKAHGGAPVASDVADAVVLPLVGDRGGIDARVVIPVTVDLDAPRGQWTVYVDAVTAEPVARRQRLMFATGNVSYRVPDRYPDGGYSDHPAAYANHTVDGAAAVSTATGAVTWSGTTAGSLTPGLTGPYAQVISEVEPATALFSLSPGGSLVWDLSDDEKGDAQLTAFIHANLVKQYAKDNFDSELPWLFDSMNVYVNVDGQCNAYSNGDDIHFYPEGNGCANTARLADVVYHEFGHSLHGQSLLDGRFDGAFSEGISDFMSATITEDPAMGLGFFLSELPLRHIDPANFEHRWPEHVDLSIHETGLIIAGAMWDLHGALSAELGESAGHTLIDDLFYEMVRRSDGIPSAYVEVLAADDDDGNLANGTPHQCTIDHAFAAHGLTAFEGAGYGIVAPTVSDQRVLSLAHPVDRSNCPIVIDTATVTWRLRETPTVIGSVVFDVTAAGATAAIPPQLDGNVVQYQVHATLDDGTVWRLPRNDADDWYELYVGPVTKLYCANMDTDPTLDGWMLTGDFAWAAAEPGSNDLDAPTAFTGTNVVGTKLGGRGAYGDLQTSDAFLPELDVSGYNNVRLQYYRWLSTEDRNRDPAAILADGAPLWTNAATPTGQLDHRDIEWRFHDVDLTALSGNGKVKVQFQQRSDDARQLGGWTIDDVCIVAAGAPVCGDERVSVDEQCDDGNGTDGDGCSAGCNLEGGLEESPPGCCSTGNSGGAEGTFVLGLLTIGVASAARRRRRV